MYVSLIDCYFLPNIYYFMDRKLLRGVSVFIALFFLNIKIHKTSVSLGTIVASATLFLFPHKVLSIQLCIFCCGPFQDPNFPVQEDNTVDYVLFMWAFLSVAVTVWFMSQN